MSCFASRSSSATTTRSVRRSFSYVADYELGGLDAVRHTVARAESMGIRSDLFLRQPVRAGSGG